MKESAATRQQLLDHVRSLRGRLAGLERAEAEIRALARHQSAIARLAQRALAEPDAMALLPEAVGRAVEALGADAGWILEMLGEGGRSRVRAASGLPDVTAGRTLRAAPRRRNGRGHPIDGPVIVDDLSAEPASPASALLAGAGLTSGVSVAIPGRASPFGVLGVYSRARRRFTAHDLNFLQSVASLLGEAMELHGARAALRETEERFRLFMENSPSVAFIKSPEGHLLFVNRSFCAAFGRAPEEFIGRDEREFFPEATCRQFQANDRTVLDSGGPVELIENVPTPDGVDRRWLVYKFPLADRSGRRLIGGTAVDLTDRLAAQEELARQTEVLKSILNSMGDGVVVADEQGNFLLFNPAAERIAGVGMIRTSPERWTDDFGIFLPDGVTPHPVSDIPLMRAIRGESVDAAEMVLRRPDLPQGVRLSLTARPLRGEDGSLRGGVVVFHDVTAARQAGEEIRDSRARLELLHGIATASNAGLPVETIVERALVRLAGRYPRHRAAYSTVDEAGTLEVVRSVDPPGRESLVGRRIRLAAAPGFLAALRSGKTVALEDVARDEQARPLARAVEAVGDRAVLVAPLRHSDRLVGLVCLHAERPTRWTDDEAATVRAIAEQLAVAIRDARAEADRRRAEEALRESEEKHRLLFERSPHPMWVFDVGTLRFLAVNDAAVSAYGYTRDEFLAMTIRDIRPEEDVPALLAAVQGAARDPGIRSHGFWRHRRKDGTLFDVEVVGEDFTFAGRPARLVLATDITERRRAEEERLRTSKLESIGVLAGGIAHDFNNALTAILGNLLLARSDVRPDGAVARRLGDAEQACLRARELTHQLLTFARGGDPVRRPMPLAALAREAADLVTRGSDVRCEFDLPDDLWMVEVDPGQIGQVIGHLVLNAREAMAGGGVVRLRAANLPAGGPAGPGADAPPAGPSVRLEVEDRGVGIAPEHLARIFDPYFTTKEAGSGLGLSIAHSIVGKHGGRIGVTSRPGSGTTFSVDLPAVTGAAPRPREAGPAAAPDAAAATRARILVMDDETPVKQALGAILSHFGYAPEFAGDGAEAIEKYRVARDAGCPFAAVILDLTVPGGMGGRDTVRRLLEIDPEARAIVSSGYSNDPVMANYRSYGFRGVVPKPFRLEELQQVLLEVLAPGRG